MFRLTIARCLALGLTAIIVVLVAIVGVAVVSLSDSRRTTDDLAATASLVRDAQQAKFRTADFAGWQTGCSFDTLCGGPGATSDDVGQRQEFLASTAAFRDDLDRVGARRLTSGQEEDLATTREELDAFMAVDAKIVAAYRSGDPQQVLLAHDLASGESLERFGAMTDSLEDLVVAGRERSKVAAADRTDRLLVGAGLGFAVVAGEAEALAGETTRATEDIAARVESIQTDTTGAVEEQTATTQEMSRSVAEAASSTSQGAARAQGSTADLARLSGELRVLVGRFTV